MEQAIYRLQALRGRLDERSKTQPGFSVVRNDHLPGKPVSVAYLSGGLPPNIIQTGSYNEFRQLARQIVPLLVGLGETIAGDEQEVVGNLISWAIDTTENFGEMVPRGDGTWHRITVPADHPYRLVSLALDLFIAERTADSKADSKKQSSGNLIPENPEVAKLALLIKRRWQDAERRNLRKPTKAEIAREFTEGDEAKADSLLRQLRRFPAMLE